MDGKKNVYRDDNPFSSIKCRFVNGDGRAGTLENKAGGGQKREETAGCSGSRTRAEGEKIMRNVEFFNDF